MPFILRPERVGVESWLGVLKDLSRNRSPSDSPEAWLKRFVPSMTFNAEVLGVSFDFENAEVGNSLDSLRLLHWAGTKYGYAWNPRGGEPFLSQEILAEALAELHFSNGKTVGRHENLLAAVRSVGMDMGEASAVLKDPSRYRLEVTRGIPSNVHSIPVIVIEVVRSSEEELGSEKIIFRSVVRGAASTAEFSVVLAEARTAVLR